MFVFVLDLILKEKDITVKELAVEAGISESYLYNIVENKKNNVSLDILYRIAEVIEDDPKNFFYAESEFTIIQKQMDDLIAKNGVNDSKVRFYSTILDRLFVLKLRKQ